MVEAKNDSTEEYRVKKLPVGKLFPNPNQPRKTFNKAKLEELGLSIAENGLKQPIQVVKSATHDKDGTYMIVAGERRWRCFSALGKRFIPAFILNDGIDAFVWALIENTNREEINPIEEAMAFFQLKEGGLSQKDITRRIGKKDSGFYVSTRLSLLRLPDQLQNLIADGQIAVSVGLVFARRCETNEEMQQHFSAVCKRVHGVSRLTESIADNYFEEIGRRKRPRNGRPAAELTGNRVASLSGNASRILDAARSQRSSPMNGSAAAASPVLQGTLLLFQAMERLVGPNVKPDDSRRQWSALPEKERSQILRVFGSLKKHIARLEHMCGMMAQVGSLQKR